MSGSVPCGRGLRRCHREGSDVVTSAQTSHVTPLLNHSGVTALPVLPIKGSLFYSVGIKTLFTPLLQGNSPGDSKEDL